MTTKNSRTNGQGNGHGSAHAGQAGGGRPLDLPQQMLGAARNQLALATAAAAVLFRGSEAIRKIQLDAAHQASQRHELVAQELNGECTPTDIANLHQQLLDFDLKHGAQYWQKMAAAMLNTQVELMACASHLADGAPEPVYQQVVSAWQNAVAAATASASSAASRH